MDQLDVMYQWAFMASPLQQGLYQISPAQERYYDIMANNSTETNVGSEETINRTFPTLSKSLKNCQGTLCEKDPQT